MASSVKVTLYPARIDALTAKVTHECAARAASKAVDRVQHNIAASGRVRTGRMLGSIRSRILARTTEYASFRVYSTVFYTLYQDQGTRGSQAAPGRVLKIDLRSGVIFRPRSGPIPAGRFFERALRSVTALDFA